MNLNDLPESAKLAISALVLVILVVVFFKGLFWAGSFVGWLQNRYIASPIRFRRVYRFVLFGSMLVGLGGILLGALVRLVLNVIHWFNWITLEAKSQVEAFLADFNLPVSGFLTVSLIMLFFVSSLKRKRGEAISRLLEEGNLARALQELEQIHREPGMTVSVDAELDTIYAYALVMAGQVPRALDYLRDSERRMRGSTKFQSWISTVPEHLLRYNAEAVELQRLRIGDILCELGYFHDALQLTDEGVSQTSTDITRLRLRGVALVGLGRLDEAETSFISALRESEPISGDREVEKEIIAVQVHLGRCLLLAHNYRAAIKTLEEAQSKLEDRVARGHPELVECQCLLARAYAAKRRTDAAAELFYSALDDELKFLSMAATGMREGDLLRLTDRMQVHLDQYLGFVVDHQASRPAIIPQGMIQALRRKGLALQAVAWLKQKKDASTPTDPRLEKVRQELAEILFSATSVYEDDLQQRIDALDAERVTLEAAFYHDRGADGMRVDTDTITLRAIQQNLPPDAVLVQFLDVHLGDSEGLKERRGHHYVAFIFPPSGRDPILCDLGPSGVIEPLVARFMHEMESYETSGGQRPERWRSLARRLYEVLVRGWAEIGEKYKQWILVLDGQLNFVPFPALMDAEERFLVERCRVSVVGSVRDLMHQLTPVVHRPDSDAVLVGDPSFDLSRLAASTYTSRGLGMNPLLAHSLARHRALFSLLPGTREEVKSIEALLASGGFKAPTVLLGPHARKDRVVGIQTPSILHLATHAFFLAPDAEDIGSGIYSFLSRRGPGAFVSLARSPYLQSGLAFAGANKLSQAGSALLTAEEVLSMDLRETDLVVLSACQSALGSVMRGEGVLGLHRAFMIAGARNVVASLWKVPDQETVVLMRYFYSEYMQNGRKSLALQKAMLQLITHLKQTGRDPHPGLWGAFFCFGPPIG